MTDDLQNAILCLLENASSQGMPMGYLVDRVCHDGGDADEAEACIWSLLQDERIIVSGYVRRVVRQSDPARGAIDRRTYEFVLALPEGSS